MAKITTEDLRKCKIFKNADQDIADGLIADSRLVKFGKNNQIVFQADISNDVYLVVEGTARAKSFSENGKEVSFLDINCGELFGEFSAIDKAPRSTAVVAVTDCVVAKFSTRCFRQFISQNNDAAMALVELLVEKNRALTERIHEFGTLPVRIRVQCELLRLAEAECGDDEKSARFTIPTHSELANRICTHREAVTKELSYLISLGLVKISKGVVSVDDYQGFRQNLGNSNY